MQAKDIQGIDLNGKDVYRESSRKTQQCFASDNPDYTNMMVVKGDGSSEGHVTFYYSIIEDSTGMMRDMLSAQIVYQGLGWVGFGISETGKMTGSEAVIGIPDESNSSINPGRYMLGGYTQALVSLMENQTLSDASIVQTDTTTTLTFSKLLSEEDGMSIKPDGTNIFLFAVGNGNTLAYHKDRGVFQVDFSDMCEGELEESQQPKEGMQTDASEQQSDACISDNPDYANQIPLGTNGDVTFYYSITDDQTALSAQVVYRGLGWVSWAVSSDGQMVGSEAVIGLPDDSSVQKYALSSKSNDGVTPLPSQTLIDASVVQTDTTTILTFTKILSEPNEIPIPLSGPQFFLWAVGSSNGLGYHASRAPFQLDLSQGCAGAVVGVASPTQSLWRTHGILAAIGWAIATPLAIMSSWFRELSKGKGTWFKAHFYLNSLTTFLTVMLFIIATVAVSKSGGSHFSIPHHIVGLVMFIVVILHVILGVFRPHIEQGKEKTSIRRYWEICHKTFGYFLLAASIYQVQSGLKLLSRNFGTKSYVWAYWGWLIALVVVNGAYFAWSFFKKRSAS